MLTIAFVAGLPGVLLTVLGSSLLGVALLRRGFRPRATSWLLALTFPLMFVISAVTSMGSIALPVAFAFGIAGRRFVREQSAATTRQTADGSGSLLRARG